MNEKAIRTLATQCVVAAEGFTSGMTRHGRQDAIIEVEQILKEAMAVTSAISRSHIKGDVKKT